MEMMGTAADLDRQIASDLKVVKEKSPAVYDDSCKELEKTWVNGAFANGRGNLKSFGKKVKAVDAINEAKRELKGKQKEGEKPEDRKTSLTRRTGYGKIDR